MSLAQHILAFAGTFNGWLVLSVFHHVHSGRVQHIHSLRYRNGLDTGRLQRDDRHFFGIQPGFALDYRVDWQGNRRMALYHIAGLGRGPIMRLYNRLFGKVISERLSEGGSSTPSLPARLLRRINLLSPFSITFGRLIWLRVPLTIILSMRRQRKLVVESVALFSVVWDGIYLLIGVIGGNATVSPTRFVLYSVIGLTVLYTIFFIARQAGEWWLKRRERQRQ